MHQDATWYVGRPQARRLCVRWVPAPYPKRGGTPPNFRPTSIVAKHLHGSRCHLVWTGGRPRPGHHCVRCGPSYTPRGAAPQISAHVCFDQTAGWIKISLGTKVGLGPGHIVLHGDPAPPPKRGAAPNFRPMSIVTKRSPISATAEHLFCKYVATYVLTYDAGSH